MKLLTFIACMYCGAAIASQSPLSGQNDSRIKSVLYQQDNVVEMIGQLLTKTTIEFAKDESILDVSIGDSMAWMVRFKLWKVKPTFH